MRKPFIGQTPKSNAETIFKTYVLCLAVVQGLEIVYNQRKTFIIT